MPASTGTFVVHEKFVIDDPMAVNQRLNEILGGGYEIDNPMNDRHLLEMAQSRHEGNAWFMWAEQEGKLWFLDGFTLDEPLSVSRGFLPWLKEFRPKNCNDWLLAPRLYAHTLISGNSDWKNVASRKIKVADRLLAASRGLLVWEYQYRYLMYLADENISKKRTHELFTGYAMKKPTALEELDSLWIDGVSLRALFDEHQDYYLGSPNFYVSGLLSEFLIF